MQSGPVSNTAGLFSLFPKSEVSSHHFQGQTYNSIRQLAEAGSSVSPIYQQKTEGI